MRPVLSALLVSGCTQAIAPDAPDRATPVADTAAPTPPTADDTGAPAADGWPACDPTATTQRVSVVHVNDMHGEYGYDPAFPGESVVSRAVGYYKSVRRENPYTLWTNGGDDFEKGSVIEDVSGGVSTTEIVRLMGFDVRALGNHDYAFGEERILDHTADPHAVVLASNARYVGERPDAWKAVETAIFEIGCVKVGLYSFNTPPWITKGHCQPGAEADGDCHYLGGIVEHDYDFVAQGQATIDALASQVDLVIALNHLGMGADEDLMTATRGTHLALGSHSHSFTSLPVPRNGTWLIQAGSNNAWVIRMDVVVDLTTREPVDWDYIVQPNLPELGMPVDDATEAALRERFTFWVPEIFDPVAEVSAGLTKRETAAVMARAVIAQGGADAAVLDASWLREGLSGGPVNLQELFHLVPHEREPPGTPSITSYWTTELTGAELKLVVAAATGDLVYVGPDAGAIVDGATYTLGSQKRQAELPMLFMPGAPVLSAPTFVGEHWKVMLDYANAREASGWWLDADAAHP